MEWYAPSVSKVALTPSLRVDLGGGVLGGLVFV